MGAVGEGDLLNALVLQIAQRPEGAGENGTVGTDRQGQNAVRGFRLVLQRAAIQVEHPVERLPLVGFFLGGSGFRRLYRADDGVQNGSVAAFALYLAGGIQPGGVRFFLAAVNRLITPVVISTVSDGCAAAVP